MAEKKSNKLPLFYFVAGILITIYGISQIDSINNINSEEHILPMLFIGLFGTWSLISFITLLKDGFFSFLKRKRFQFPFWVATTLTLGIFVYVNNANSNIGMLVVNTFFLCLSIIFLSRVTWKVLSETGYDDPSL